MSNEIYDRPEIKYTKQTITTNLQIYLEIET
ncbi:hypothetical protein HMPREF1092_01794 [Clostridium thermobutyricum]|uniref:Uncharacterized protein n=1 Tax=Clostridium thermobutyricum TaxID=29372 RepID=N9Y314_9CLOT|nr:hypothetical protein HMPREF1092_01794 [Clostridium thermobutyricum]